MSIDLSSSKSAAAEMQEQLFLDTQNSINAANLSKSKVEEALHKWDKARQAGKENDYKSARTNALDEFEKFKENLGKINEYIQRCEKAVAGKFNPRLFQLQSQFTFTLVKTASFERLIGSFS